MHDHSETIRFKLFLFKADCLHSSHITEKLRNFTKLPHLYSTLFRAFCFKSMEQTNMLTNKMKQQTNTVARTVLIEGVEVWERLTEKILLTD